MKKQLLLITLIFVLLLNASYSSLAARSDKEISITKNSNWNFEKLKISTEGNLTFNDNYTDVISLSEDAYLKISVISFGMKRKLYISSDEGRVVYRYFEGSREINFEPKGREWMKKILPDVIRNSGLDLENRVNKIYQKKGVEGFLKELEQTDSDYYKSRMVAYLLKNNKLERSDLQSLLREFPYRIDSDYELSQIYKKYNSAFLLDLELSKEFFNSLDELSSDYELSQVLKSVYKRNELDKEKFSLFIDVLDNISSDYEKSNLMKIVLSSDRLTNKQLSIVLEQVKSLSSDYEKSKIIKSLLYGDRLSNDNIKQIIELSHSISSDYEMTQIINTMIKGGMLNNANFDVFVDLIGEISSDYSYTDVLKSLIEYDELGVERFDFLLKASDKISSNYELSRFYHALLNKQELTVDQQLKLILKAGNISSSYELAKFLLAASQKMDLNNDKIYDALLNTTQNISSKYEYGKVMKVIYAHRKNR